MDRYDDRQMKRILEKSLEIEKRSARKTSSRKEYGVEEILGLAQELGVSETSLRSAIASEKAEALSYSSFIGGPTVIECRTLAGEASEAALRRVFRQLPEIAGVPGDGIVEAEALHWEADDFEAVKGIRNYAIEIEGRSAGTEIIVRNRIAATAGGIFGGAMGTLCLGAALLGLPLMSLSPLFTGLFAVAALYPSYIISKRAYAIVVRRARKRMGAILEAIAAGLSGE